MSLAEEVDRCSTWPDVTVNGEFEARRHCRCGPGVVDGLRADVDAVGPGRAPADDGGGPLMSLYRGLFGRACTTTVGHGFARSCRRGMGGSSPRPVLTHRAGASCILRQCGKGSPDEAREPQPEPQRGPDSAGLGRTLADTAPLVTCANRASADPGGRLEADCGSGGRRFKSCQPDSVVSQYIGVARTDDWSVRVGDHLGPFPHCTPIVLGHLGLRALSVMSIDNSDSDEYLRRARSPACRSHRRGDHGIL